MNFILGFVDQKAHVVKTNGRGSCSLLDAADHLLLLPSDGLSPLLAAVQHKISESVVCEVHRFLYVSILSFSLSSSLALSNLVVTSGRRPVVHPPSFFSSPGSPSPLPIHGPPLQPTSPKPRRFLQRRITSRLCPARIINLPISISTETGVPHRTIFAAATTPSSR